jgi:hypothetical protein
MFCKKIVELYKKTDKKSECGLSLLAHYIMRARELGKYYFHKNPR